MTPNEAIKEYESIKYDYMKSRNAVSARERLHPLFTECFDMYKLDEAFRGALERAYALLRQIENDTACLSECRSRYDVSFAAEDLVFCANILLANTDKNVLYKCDFSKAFINPDLKSFSLAFLSLVANAVSYSTEKDILVKLSLFDGFVGISVSNTGIFPAEIFQNSVNGNGSLSFVNRLLSASGGSLIMTNGQDKTTVAVKIPVADSKLPCTLPLSVDDLLCDRLSVLYIAFCGH